MTKWVVLELSVFLHSLVSTDEASRKMLTVSATFDVNETFGQTTLWTSCQASQSGELIDTLHECTVSRSCSVRKSVAKQNSIQCIVLVYLSLLV